MDNFIQALEAATKGIQKFFEQMLKGLLDLLNKTQRWLAVAVNRIQQYLHRLFVACSRLFVALSKLAILYLPGIIAFMLGIVGSVLWLVIVGAVWILLITVVGLTYRKETEQKDSHDESAASDSQAE